MSQNVRTRTLLTPQTEIHANIKFGASIFGKCRSIPLADHTVHGNSSVLTASDRVTKNGSVQKNLQLYEMARLPV